MSGLSQGVCWRLGPQREGFARCYLSDEQFEAAELQSGLGSEIRTLFEKTTPRWYGLWLGQSLSRTQCRVLIELFTAGGLSSGNEKAEWDITVPLHAALAEGIPLQVEASTPGHTDFGFWTTHVHCPRCKCEGPFKRWQESYPTELHRCGCCGHDYSPASTSSQVREYALNSFECSGCGKSVSGESLTDAQLDILEDRENHQETLKEWEWLERVTAFYRRRPEAQAFFESLRISIGSGGKLESVPSASQFRTSLLDEQGHEDWKTEDAEVIDYIERHNFSLAARRKHVSESLSRWSMEDHPDVRCEVCGGELRRSVSTSETID